MQTPVARSPADATAPIPATPMDAEGFKRATRDQWDACAAGWNGNGRMVRNWLRDPTLAMIEMAGIGPGDRVLDIAAGAGDQTLDIAARVGPTGSVLATDLSPAILQFAQDNARRAGHTHVAVAVADGERLGLPDVGFDAALCRLGLMLFPDPLAGLREMARVLKPGGRACTLVFSAPDRNPCVSILMSTALAHAGLPPRDPYRPGGLLSLGEPGLIDSLFRGAGFSRVATTRIAAPFRLAVVTEYLDFVRTSASPILQILGRLDDEARQAAWSEIEAKLRRFDTDAGWEGPNELLLTVGQR